MIILKITGDYTKDSNAQFLMSSYTIYHVVIQRQLDGIELNKCFIDKASGKDVMRPQLLAMLNYIREGDTVIIHSMDRLARNLDDLRRLVHNITAQNIRIQFLKESLTFSGDDTAMSKFLLSVMGAFAEFERSLIKERQMEGIALAKKRSAYKGRKPKLTREQLEDIKKDLACGAKKSHVAKKFQISRETSLPISQKLSSF